MAEQFKNYSVNDFDKFDCVRLSKTFYLALVFLLRGYVVWLMSVTNFKNTTGIIQTIYPDPTLFYLNLVSGCLGLFVLLMMSLRRPEAAPWVKKCWPHTLTIILIALAIDAAIVAIGYSVFQLTTFSGMLIQVIGSVACGIICLFSKRLKINLQEFPEPLPEK